MNRPEPCAAERPLPTAARKRGIRSDDPRLNGLKHGGTARKLFLPDENPETFFFILQNAFEVFQPTNHRDARFVADAVHARWFLLRSERVYAHRESTLRLRQPAEELWTEKDRHDIVLLKRYKTRAQRAFRRAFNILNHMQKHVGRPLAWQDLHDFHRECFAYELPPSRELAA